MRTPPVIVRASARSKRGHIAMIRFSNCVLACSLALLSTGFLPGQEPPGDAKLVPLVAIRAEGVEQLLKQWPTTRIGKLLADEDVVDACDAVRNHVKNYLARRDAVLATFHEMGLTGDMQPWEIASIYNAGDTDVWQLFRFPVDEVKRAEIKIMAPQGAGFAAPTFITTLACTPRFEGRWTQAFEQHARQRRKSKFYTEVPDAKMGGFPAYVFKAPEGGSDDQFLDTSSLGRWMLHLPGTFLYGSTNGYDFGAATPKRDPEVAMEINVESYLKMFQGMGAPIPRQFKAFGFTELKTLKWSGRFVDELIQDELSAELSGDPNGIVGALLTGQAKLPAQALPKGAIAQLRSSVNLEKLTDLVALATTGMDMPEDLVKDVLKAFDGGAALSCCSPAPGGVIPRIYLTLNVNDGAALDRLFAKLLRKSMPTKKVTYGGVECTIIKIPDVPNGIQPAFCHVDGKLHIAESGRSLRTFLKAQEGEAVAMEVGDAPTPAGQGEVLSSFDFRFDEAELYESFYLHWLPLWEISGLARSASLLRRDMPEPDVVNEYLGKTRGVLRKNGNRYTIAMLGTLGGPEAAATAMTWGPMISSGITDYQTEQLTRRIAIDKLEAVHDAIEKFTKREKRRPKDLAELFTGMNLKDDALWLPGDDMAEAIKLADGTEVKSSFRYFPKGTTFETMTGEDGQTILVEIRPHTYDRVIMTKTGKIPNAYGPDSQKPIDQFKGGSGESSETSAASTAGGDSAPAPLNHR